MCNENTRAAVPEDRAAGGVQAFQWPNGTKPELHELLNGSLQIVDAVEDAPLLTITGHNGVDPRAFLNFLSGDVAARIVECARAVNAATFSHVDGRDLLAELHPRYEIDIKVRRDGQDRWYEGDWLSRVWDAIKPLRAALAAAPATEAATSAPEARGGLIERALDRIQILEAASRLVSNDAIGSTLQADADMIRDLLAALQPAKGE